MVLFIGIARCISLLNANLFERHTGVATLTLATVLTKVHIVTHMAGTTFGRKFYFTGWTLVAGIAFQF